MSSSSITPTWIPFTSTQSAVETLAFNLRIMSSGYHSARHFSLFLSISIDGFMCLFVQMTGSTRGALRCSISVSPSPWKPQSWWDTTWGFGCLSQAVWPHLTQTSTPFPDMSSLKMGKGVSGLKSGGGCGRDQMHLRLRVQSRRNSP